MQLFDGVGTRYEFLNAMRRCGDKLLGIRGISSGFFVKRRVFVSANGFRDNVMEEAVDFQKQNKELGEVRDANQSIVSSSRRFAAKRGFCSDSRCLDNDRPPNLSWASFHVN